MPAYTLGLDFGTNSVRCLIVDSSTGYEVGTGIYQYPSGANGVILDQEDIATNYELNTGRAIVHCFVSLDPKTIPGVLVEGHGPFTWGKDAYYGQEDIEK
jgi:L-ribulose-5-phosphate 4-epimerase